MRHTAILTVIFLMMGLTAGGTVDPPLAVSFRLADGVRMSGRITEWDQDSFDGTFGLRRWTDLNTNDAKRLYRRVMDRDSADDWVNLGRFLLIMPNGDRTAERAFAEALRLDSSVNATIDAARAEAEAHARATDESDRAERSAENRTRSPEALDWPATRWPSLSPDERETVLKHARHDARIVLESTGVIYNRLETDNVMLYSRVARSEAAPWARSAERAFARTRELLGVDPSASVFHGKAVAMVFDDQTTFRRVVSEEFDHVVAGSVIGVCNYDGPNVHLCFYRSPDDFALRREIARQAVHGCLHRYISPRKLPRWANEGLPEFIVAQLDEDVQTMTARRDGAIRFIRSGGDLARILLLTYDNRLSPDELHLPASVGALFIEIMATEQPARFAHWAAAVKSGKEWTKALREDYGATPTALIEACAAYYRVND